MRIKLGCALGQLDGINGDIRAVVADLLKVMHNIQEMDTGLHGALVPAQTLDVAALETLLHRIHNFFQRLDHTGGRNSLIVIAVNGHVEHLGNRFAHGVQLLHRTRREGQTGLTELVGTLKDVLRIVADLLKIGQRVHHLGHLAALIDRTDVVDGGQVTANLNLCTVEEGLVLVEDLLVCSRAAEQRVGCQMEILLGGVAHVSNAALCLIECQGRRGQEARLQLCQRVFLRLLGRHACRCQLDQQTGERQEQHRTGEIEQRMEVCDAALVDCVIPERETNRVLNRINADQEQDGADQVEVEVYHRGTAGILGAAHRGQECGDTGTDVLTEDDRDSSRIGDRTRGRQRLQNTNRCGGRLDDRGNARADQHAEHRIGDSSEQIRELRQISQRCNRALHDRHADEQNTETGEDIRDIAGTALFCKHHNDYADQHDDICQILRLEQIHEQVAAALAAGQTQDLRGNRGTDVGTEDNADRLLERHDTGVYKADNHNGRCGRRLNDHGNDHAHQQSSNDIARHFFKRFLQFRACCALQTLSHCRHTVDEQRKTADHLHD